MSLRDAIDSDDQTITFQVLVGGHQLANVTGVETSAGLSQINAQAGVRLTERPAEAVETASCEVWAGYNGQTLPIFKGELAGIDWSHFPTAIGLDGRDKLARTRLDWGGDDRVYTSTDDAALIRNLLEAMGIPSSEAHIESSGWTLGVVQEVIAQGGRAFWPLIEEIDTFSGFKTFSYTDGTIRRYRISGAAAATPAWTYQEGVNIISCRRKRGVAGIVNRVIVTGVTYLELRVGGPGVAEAAADNPFVPNPPRYITKSEQSDLVEDDDKAREIASRMVADRNRRPESYDIEVHGNPYLQPGMTIRVEHSEVVEGAANLLIDRVQHRIEGASFRTTITTLGGNLDTTTPPAGLPPTIAIDVKLFREGEDTGSGVALKTVLVADASGTTDPDSDPAGITYAWTFAVDTGTITPDSGSDAVMRCVIDGGATSVTIELTATDSDSNDATLTRTVPIDTSTVLVEPIYGAIEDLIAVSDDGEQTWTDYTLPGGAESLCLMPIAPSWGQVWGADNGHLYATIDMLATAAVDLGAPHGSHACTAVWVHEGDNTRLWAGFDDGKVYFATVDPVAQTASWRLAGTVPASPVQEIRESIGALDSLRATAGNSYYGSEDGGNTWTLIHDFTSQAWRMAGGWETNLASALDNDSPLFAETGTAPTLPVLTPAVRHIRGLSPGWRIPEWYLADDQGRLFRADDLLTAMYIADAPTGINHSIRSGNADGVVYHAGDGGIVKTIRNEVPWYIRQTGARTVRMVGYGPAHPIVGAFEILLVPQNATGADDKIRRFVAGAWIEIDPPMASWYWGGIAANPFNQDEWLLWGTDNSSHWSYRNSSNTQTHGDGYTGTHSPLWYTANAGATWTEVPLTQDGGMYGASPGSDPMFAVWDFLAWDETTNGRWALLMNTNAFGNDGWLWVGNGATATNARFYNDFVISTIAPAPAGEWISTKFNGPERPLLRISASGVLSTLDEATTIPSGNTFTWHAAPALLPGTHSIVGLREDTANGWGVADYLTDLVDAHFTVSGTGNWITAATHGVYVAASGGIVAVTDPLGSSSTAVVGSSGHDISYIRAGRRQHRTVAALRGDKTAIYVSPDGVTWQEIVLPTSWDTTKITAMLEILERGA